jgi:TPR repeat protein
MSGFNAGIDDQHRLAVPERLGRAAGLRGGDAVVSKAADAGSIAGAMIFIGMLYQNGLGVPQDYAEAIKWFRKAADAGRR